MAERHQLRHRACQLDRFVREWSINGKSALCCWRACPDTTLEQALKVHQVEPHEWSVSSIVNVPMRLCSAWLHSRELLSLAIAAAMCEGSKCRFRGTQEGQARTSTSTIRSCRDQTSLQVGPDASVHRARRQVRVWGLEPVCEIGLTSPPRIVRWWLRSKLLQIFSPRFEMWQPDEKAARSRAGKATLLSDCPHSR